MEEPTYDPGRPMATTTIIYQHKLANCPGRTIVGMLVKCPPNGATPPHRHGGASVSAYVIQGSVMCKMNDEPMRLVQQDGSWYEAPGCHHRISANASESEPAVFVVSFVLETELLEREGPGVLVQIDEEYREVVAGKRKG
ncbi:cupin domain-containing protein [Aspergillus saccharolyticus JOP 1030-1]|uniref:Cupin domain protein n=1 Tax=Aspergillus saccharolyticus JOP 1030-1 TaxID=1450539 RepID=A0A318ZJ40_9EURO|nr:cupin domain protein [Aspergillus saccharolyticus JOP 1030-1]PYH44583.1 cupin domain protein [Aspergillus saccharolyticus JOP 1030-1]